VDALDAKFDVSDADAEFYIMEKFYDYKMTDKRPDEVLTRQCPCLGAFDSWREHGRLADSTASDRNMGTHEFTQVRPPRRVKTYILLV
jgi:hypothetical protein